MNDPQPRDTNPVLLFLVIGMLFLSGYCLLAFGLGWLFAGPGQLGILVTLIVFVFVVILLLVSGGFDDGEEVDDGGGDE